MKVRVSALFDRVRFRFPLELEIISPDIEDHLNYLPPADRPMIFYADEEEEDWAREMFAFGRTVRNDDDLIDPDTALGQLTDTGLLAAGEAAIREEQEEEEEFADEEVRSEGLPRSCASSLLSTRRCCWPADDAF